MIEVSSLEAHILIYQLGEGWSLTPIPLALLSFDRLLAGWACECFIGGTMTRNVMLILLVDATRSCSCSKYVNALQPA